MSKRFPSRHPTLTVLCVFFAFVGALFAASSTGNAQNPDRSDRLAHVDHWFYYLSVDLESDDLDQIIASTYDLVVIDPVITEKDNEDYNIAATVRAIQESGNGDGQPRLVIAYLDIGQAESYRTYWQPGWQVGSPDWIVGEDPDGWAENYPVAYWYDEWQAIWFDGPDALLQTILDAGFDGVYLDWIEAYSDENVLAFAEREGLDPQQEMVWFIEDIGTFAHAQDLDHLVIAQNAAELVEIDGYLDLIDAIAQEQIWFDGGADGAFAEGDCPLPATDAAIDTPAYYESLPEPCRALYDLYPDSTLHVSSEEYLYYLTLAHDQGEFILTVDYALDPANVAAIYERSRALGFVPFAGPRSLDRFIPPYP
ncbi:MAG: endo alpha-1,4 polygalactosaminidase [Anaerolineae bacterium]|nr:endo alpha-1,4 polygalactosaminidase [Anaerolineae bacterium]